LFLTFLLTSFQLHRSHFPAHYPILDLWSDCLFSFALYQDNISAKQMMDETKLSDVFALPFSESAQPDTNPLLIPGTMICGPSFGVMLTAPLKNSIN
jgi:hypothetical protein